METPTLIFETVHGSRAYGLATEGSDTDLKGVIVGPRKWYFGFRPSPEQLEPNKDHVLFEIRKLLRLAAKANPTVLELFFTDPSFHQTLTPAGERLLALAPRLLSRKIAESFGGYALGQLKRIETHRGWLLHPPAKVPERADFGLPERGALSKSTLGAYDALQSDAEGSLDELGPRMLDRLRREKSYQAARERFAQYQQWRRHRNPKRSELEAKFGYDTKHGMHLIRLQRMACEALRVGTLKVLRDDREELLGIRRGDLSYESLLESAEANATAIRELKKESPLPESVDLDAIESCCDEVICSVLAGT